MSLSGSVSRYLSKGALEPTVMTQNWTWRFVKDRKPMP